MDRAIVEILKKRHAKAVFSVIPFRCAGAVCDPSPQKRLPLTPRKVSLLKDAIQAAVIDVAMHGYSHQTIGLKLDSEFAGDQYDAQLSKIREGKRYLESVFDVPVTSFVPPFNRYDENTCRALSVAGIRLLSGSLLGPTSSSLQFLPATASLPGLVDCVKRRLADQGSGQLIVALFHPFDFQESGDSRAITTLEEFDDVVGWLSSHENVRIATFGDESDAGVDLTAQRYWANHPKKLTWSTLLPQGLRPTTCASGAYLTQSAIASAHRTAIATVLGLYAAIVAPAGGLGFLAARVLRTHHLSALFLLVPFTFAVVLVLMLRGRFLRGVRHKALAAALGRLRRRTNEG